MSAIQLLHIISIILVLLSASIIYVWVLLKLIRDFIATHDFMPLALILILISVGLMISTGIYLDLLNL